MSHPRSAGFVDLRGKTAALGTMHGKEQVIAPVLRDALDVRVSLAEGLDTDRFGTFTRDRERAGTQLEAARHKAWAALERVPAAALGVASEGSFGPHPEVPFLVIGVELVLLVDRASGLEIVGRDVTLEPRYAQRVVRRLDEVVIFADQAGLPEHGAVVMGVRGGGAQDEAGDWGRGLHKGLHTVTALVDAARPLLERDGRAWLESDMRAHHNPTRMKAIARASADLASHALHQCPRCARPGFAAAESVPGLPCEL